jgi:hypothetical protein
MEFIMPPQKTIESVADNKNNADPFFQFLWHSSLSLFQSVNQVDYLEVLRHVRDVAQMWIAGTWHLNHENAQLTQHC